MHFTAVTFNVLAQAYAHPDRYPHSSPADLDARRRRALLLERVAAFNADLYLLQEVEQDAFDDIAAALPEHEGHYGQRIGRPDGCAVFVRTARLPIVGLDVFRYTVEEQVAIVVAMEQAGRRFIAVSTHLRWQPPGTPPGDHTGYRQLEELLGALPDGVPRLICGDLNANSQSAPISLARARGLRLSCRSQRPWDTTNINGRRRKLDYLLYDPGAWAPQPGTLQKLERNTPMPSQTEPSDHLPVDVRFDWRD